MRPATTITCTVAILNITIKLIVKSFKSQHLPLNFTCLTLKSTCLISYFMYFWQYNGIFYHLPNQKSSCLGCHILFPNHAFSVLFACVKSFSVLISIEKLISLTRVKLLMKNIWMINDLYIFDFPMQLFYPLKNLASIFHFRKLKLKQL